MVLPSKMFHCSIKFAVMLYIFRLPGPEMRLLVKFLVW